MADLLGYLYALSGRVAQGQSLLEEALTALESMGMFQWRSSVLVHLGEAYLLADRLEDALTLAERALTLTTQRGHRGYEAWTRRLFGEIVLRQNRPDTAAAEAHYGAALTLASELGMRPLVAHCHLGFGRLYRRTDDAVKGEEHLASATAMYREIGMTFWVEKAEALGSPP